MCSPRSIMSRLEEVLLWQGIIFSSWKGESLLFVSDITTVSFGGVSKGSVPYPHEDLSPSFDKPGPCTVFSCQLELAVTAWLKQREMTKMQRILRDLLRGHVQVPAMAV